MEVSIDSLYYALCNVQLCTSTNPTSPFNSLFLRPLEQPILYSNLFTFYLFFVLFRAGLPCDGFIILSHTGLEPSVAVLRKQIRIRKDM